MVLHQPPLSMGLHCGESRSMRTWMTLFEQHKVDAVLAGHDHAYERLERNGVPYFVTGGGGAKLYDRSPWSARQARAAALRVMHRYVMIELFVPRLIASSFRCARSRRKGCRLIVFAPIDRNPVGEIRPIRKGPPRRFHRAICAICCDITDSSLGWRSVWRGHRRGMALWASALVVIDWQDADGFSTRQAGNF